MPKGQKEMIMLDVETVDNWSKTLAYIMTTLDFWVKEKDWPINLCYDGINDLSNQMYEAIRKFKEN